MYATLSWDPWGFVGVLGCVQAQLQHERSRDFDAPLEKIMRKTEGRRRELESLERKMEELRDREKVKRAEPLPRDGFGASPPGSSALFRKTSY